MPSATQQPTGEVPNITRALEPEVVDAIWTAIEPLLPEPAKHPLGCHRPRVADRLCFRGILIRLVTGASWVWTSKRSLSTMCRTRRCGLDATTGSKPVCSKRFVPKPKPPRPDRWARPQRGGYRRHSAQGPLRRRRDRPEPTDRAKQGWKWSLGVDRHGIPSAWSLDGANRDDVRMLQPTIDVLAARGWLSESDTVHLDRGYDYPKIRQQLADAGLVDHVIQRRRRPDDLGP